jgi:TolB protein
MKVSFKILLTVSLCYSHEIQAQRLDTLKRVIYQASDSPSWTPDGRSLLFTSPFSGNWQVYLRDLKSKKLKRLTFHDGTDETPVCSPDGKKFIFESDRNGNTDVWMMNIDGSGEERLTNQPGREIHPTWHPNGKEILFNSNSEDSLGFAIYKMDLATGKIERLTPPAEFNTYAQWSPDGTTISFVKWLKNKSSGEWGRDICIMDSLGKLIRNLTNNPDYLNGWPSWAPDSRAIVFSAKPQGKFQIYSVNSDGTNLKQMIKSTSDDRRPYWYRDHKRLAFDRTIDGTVTDLFIAYFE